MTKIHSTIKNLLLACVMLSVAGSLLSISTKDATLSEGRPNIIFIMADDLSMDDIAPYGNTQVHTPNLSRLAKQGVCLDNMFNMVPVCSPTRQSILTGLGPVRSGAFKSFPITIKY